MTPMPKKYETVEAPTSVDMAKKYDTIPLPDRLWYQIADWLTRRDELQEAILKALNVIIEQNNESLAILAAVFGVPEVPGAPVERYANYMTEDQLENKGVVNEANPVIIEVLETLGRKARYGFIYSETGTITVKINEQAPIPLKAADFLNLADQHIEVEKLRIETTSVVDVYFRMLLV